MKPTLIIPEARGNKFNLNNQRLLAFIPKSTEGIGVLAVNCNLACVSALRKASKVCLLAIKRSINVLRNGCCPCFIGSRFNLDGGYHHR